LEFYAPQLSEVFFGHHFLSSFVVPAYASAGASVEITHDRLTHLEKAAAAAQSGADNC
jgi:hypothetical protein